jgi:hypothetical protein
MLIGVIGVAIGSMGVLMIGVKIGMMMARAKVTKYCHESCEHVEKWEKRAYNIDAEKIALQCQLKEAINDTMNVRKARNKDIDSLANKLGR